MAEVTRAAASSAPDLGSPGVAIAVVVALTVLLSFPFGFSLFYVFGFVATLIAIINYEWNIALMLTLLHFAATTNESMLKYASTGRWVAIGMLGSKFAIPMLAKGKRAKISPMQIGFLFFCMAAIVSSMDAHPYRTSLYRSISLWFMFFAVFVSLWKYMDSRGKIEWFVRTSVYIGAMMIYLGFFHYYMGSSRGVRFGRFMGLYINPNTLGLVTTMQVPFAFWLVSTRKYNVGGWRTIHRIILIMAIYAAVRSGSRASMLGIMVGALAYMALRYKSRSLVYLAVIVTLVGAAYGLVREGIQTKFFQDVVYRQQTLEEGSGRLGLWKKAIKLSKKKPALGYGFGTSEFVITAKGKRSRLMIKHPHGIHTHNSFLRLLLELGWVGMAFGAVFLVSLFFKIRKLTKKIKSWELFHLAIILFSAVIAGLVDSVFESWALSVGCVLAVAFWTTVMLIYRIDSSVEDYEEKGLAAAPSA